MIAAVFTHPSSRTHLWRLLPIITPYVREVIILNDKDKRGNYWNGHRMINEVLPRAVGDEPVLTMTDDVITTDDWFARVNRLMLEVSAPAYCLFTRQRHMAKRCAERGWAKGVFPRSLYDQAVIWRGQQDLGQRVDEWLERRGKHVMSPSRQKWYDVVVQDYFVDNQIEWVVTVPCLFEHLGGDDSTVGNSVGRALSYVGDE